MSPSENVALGTDSLFGKSQVFIRRGLVAEAAGSAEEYELWASLALELLGKATLAHVHPALVADPQHFQSLFAACGRTLSPDVRTIGAKTVFERLSHLNVTFDKRAQRFCEQMALRRNAELHSGESPFSAASLAWHAPFWGAADIMLAMSGKSLELWIGTEQSKEPRQILTDAAKALQFAVEDKVARSREQFELTVSNPKDRVARVEESRLRAAPPDGFEFDLGSDAVEPVACPSCQGLGFLAGAEAQEDVTGYDDEEPWLEHLLTIYSVEEFACPVCKLHLIGRKEVEAAGMDLQFHRQDVRERQFEEEYLNE